MKMRTNIFLPSAVFLMMMLAATGCKHKTVTETDSLVADTLATDSLAVDSIAEEVVEEEMPVAADELFDDFFYNFAASKRVQKERIVFPLVVDDNGERTTIDARSWRKESFFMEQGYYTLVFNDASQVNLVKDTAVSVVTVERLDVTGNDVTHWHFKRDKGLWRMTSIKHMELNEHLDGDFLEFYERFASDSLFQQQSLCSMVSFSGPAGDDEYSTMEGELMPEQWPAFAPWLPSGILYNIVYGARPYPVTDTRIMLIRGIANGMEMELRFVLEGEHWKLQKCQL